MQSRRSFVDSSIRDRPYLTFPALGKDNAGVSDKACRSCLRLKACAFYPLLRRICVQNPDVTQ